MSEHRGISAAEKYAELEKAGASRPRCSCHGEEMFWNSFSNRPSGGGWRCFVAKRQENKRQYWANPERHRARAFRWRQENPEKAIAHNAAQVWTGGVYLGRCGFTQTEVEAMLNGASN